MSKDRKGNSKQMPFFYTFFSPTSASGFSVKTKVDLEKTSVSRTAQFRFVKKLDNSGG